MGDTTKDFLQSMNEALRETSDKKGGIDFRNSAWQKFITVEHIECSSRRMTEERIYLEPHSS